MGTSTSTSIVTSIYNMRRRGGRGQGQGRLCILLVILTFVNLYRYYYMDTSMHMNMSVDMDMVIFNNDTNTDTDTDSTSTRTIGKKNYTYLYNRWGEIASYNADTTHLNETKSIAQITAEFCEDNNNNKGEGEEEEEASLKQLSQLELVNDNGYNVLRKIHEGIIEATRREEEQEEQEEEIQLERPRQRPRPRILCMIYTHSKYNEKLIEAAVNTWAKKCDGFFAASNYTNVDLGILNVPHRGEESYGNMWQKAKSMWDFAYDHYLDSYDYFHICGDDTYVVVDNLRSYLSSSSIQGLLNGTKPYAFHPKYEKPWNFEKHPDRPLLLGQPIKNIRKFPPTFPLGGAGYTLNRAALKIFGGEISTNCSLANNTDPREDMFMASCFFDHFNLLDGGNTTMVVTDTLDGDNAFRYMPKSPNHHGGLKPAGFQRLNSNRLGIAEYGVKVGLESVSKESVSFHLQDTVPRSVLDSPGGDNEYGRTRSDIMQESIYRHHVLLFNLCNSTKH